MSAILLLALSFIEPQIPQPITWPGGVWTAEGPDNGKNFEAGSFTYYTQDMLDKYAKAHAEWETRCYGLVLQQEVQKNPIRFDFCNLKNIMPALEWTAKDGKITASTTIKAYGGVGTLTATMSKEGRRIHILIRNVSIEQYVSQVGIPVPIRVTGTAAVLEGNIVGDKAYFTGTGIRSTPNVISKVDLTADMRTGAFTASADTTMGKKYLPGALRLAK